MVPPTNLVATVNVALAAPAGTVTLPGTVNGSPPVIATAAPPRGAGAVRLTVPVTGLPPTTVLTLKVIAEMATRATVTEGDWLLLPLSDAERQQVEAELGHSPALRVEMARYQELLSRLGMDEEPKEFDPPHGLADRAVDFVAAHAVTGLRSGLYRWPSLDNPLRRGDLRFSLADISKAQKLLGYQPRYRIAEGLERAIDWYAANLAPVERKQVAHV